MAGSTYVIETTRSRGSVLAAPAWSFSAMPEQPAGLTPITAEMLADQLAELSRLRAEFAQTKRECVGGKDSVSEPEFEAWRKNFGQPCEIIDREPTAVEIRGHLPPFAREN